MKTLLLFFCLSFATPFLCLAQQEEQEHGKVLLGMVAGPTYTYFRGEEDRNDNESDYREAIGVSLKFQKNVFFFKGEVLYENKGFITDYMLMDNSGRLSGTTPLNYNFHYVTVPLLVGAYIKKLGLFLNAGPYVGFLKEVTGVYQHGEYDFTNNWEEYDYGMAIGLGYSLNIFSNLTLSAEVRHNRGGKDVDLRPLGYKTTSTALLLGIYYILSSQ